MADLPSGTVTFLFTDIEGSTRLLRQLGDGYPEVLEEHRRLLRSAFKAFGGREVDVQGDACSAAFPRAIDAVEAAVVAQRALAAHPWPEGVAVRVRMGLHTGQPMLTASGYVGLDVNRAARLCAAGHGGQVLVSQTSYHLMADALPKDTDLRRLGRYRLKGLARPEDVFQLVAPDLPANFPHLRTPRRGAAPSRRTFNVFLCHSTPDKAAVESIAEQLRRDGLEPWLDTWCLTPGGDWQEEIAAGLHGSAACAVFVGPGGLGDWTRQELGLALDRRRDAPGFRIFPVLLPGVPEPFDATTLPPQLGAHTWVDLRAGIDDPRAFQHFVNAVKGLPLGPTGPTQAREDTCPYRGLQSFDEEHAPFFFGREGDVQRLLEKLKAARFLAVVGPSGTGKSSLVRAGLLPALRRGALPGSESWPICVFTPGAQPLTTLATQLLQLDAQQGMHQTLDQLAVNERTLHLGVSLARANRPLAERAVWVIDQFEEIFTQCWDEQERAQFVANLLYAATIPEGRTVVVLTLRADFYLRCAAYPELAERVAAHQYLVSPMGEEGLRQAIEEPAWRVGLQLEPGLAETILEDVADEPGTLPLLEHALLELWEQRRSGLLTLAGYRESGGVQGAIAKRAEAVYSGFSPEGQAIMRRIMLRLTQPGEGTEDTRRRVAMSELVTRAGEQVAIERVVGELADARLVTTSGDLPVGRQQAGSGEGWVEVAHEALIRSWPRLRQWIDEDRAALRVHRILTEAAREWQRLGRDEDVLYRGTRLAEALEWRERHEAALNDLEREFFTASTALQERERSARERQHRRVTLGLGFGLVAALLLSGLAGLQWRQAEEQRQVVDQQRQVAVARELAFQAEAVRDGKPLLLPRSILLATETLKRIPSREAERTLRLGLALLTPSTANLVHEARVQGITYSPDGRYLATASADGTARLWEVPSGREAMRVAHEGTVQAVAFSPDRRNLATAGDDRTARIWEVPSGKELLRLAHDDRVYSVAYSPDGRYLVTASYDGGARLWDVTSGRQVARMQHDASVPAEAYSPYGGKQFAESPGPAIAFSPDGRYLATGRSLDRTARVWEVPGGREVARVAHDDIVLGVAFSPDSHYLATGSPDGTARVWDASNGQAIARLDVQGANPVYGVAFSPDGRYLVAAGFGLHTSVWDVMTSREVVRLPQMDTQAVAFNPDGHYLATASNDRTARVWELPSGREVARMPHENANVVYGVAFSPDGRYVAAVGDDHTVRLWEATNGWRVAGLGHDDTVTNIAFSPDGRYLATASADRTARIWDATSGQELARLAQETTVWQVAFSPDGRYLATGSYGNSTRMWEVPGGGEVARLGQESSAWAVAFSPDGRHVASGTRNGIVRIWEFAGGKEVLRMVHEGGVVRAAFSSDGQLLATASVDRTARVWDATSGRELGRMFHEDEVQGVAFSRDGQYLGTASSDGTARVWQLPGGREIQRLMHEKGAADVAFSPDGRHLATAGTDGTARIWEVVSGREVARMPHNNAVFSIAYSPDGQNLATASEDRTAQLWRTDVDELLAEACGRVTRNLTPDEWRQYLRDEPYRKTCPDLP